MPYLIDRQRALWSRELIAALNVRRRGIRTRVVSRDNSLYSTVTRTITLMRRTWARAALIVTSRRQSANTNKGAQWWTRP